MSAAGLRALAYEARSVVQTARDELSPASAGPIVVSGMLAEQLAKELGAGASAGAVVVDDGAPAPTADVLVRVLAGEPSEADESFVRSADQRRTPVVVVQLWPQADWTRPYVLSPFVVECRAGEGFPLREITDRIVEASEHGPLLASRVPELKCAVTHGVVRRAVSRSALLGLAGTNKGAARPLIALEQVRMLARLRAATTGSAGSDEMPFVAGGAALALASGFAFRGVARSARQVLPVPLADAAVAAAGTWALAKALRLLESRIPPG
ncbi:MAG: hypothetical protein OEV29_01880 [Thermoleophilia bacterium]|nr:hypothetical protein [Thermoleophilia bacterium]MDH4340667.1 hypothetical protein [Thermoleophilia bacterium]